MTFIQRHAYGCGYAFGALLWPFFPKRRRISIDNVLRCKIVADSAEAKRIAKASWCHLAGHILEALCVPRVVTKDNWREHVDFSECDPETAKFFEAPLSIPMVLVSAHHGAWEAATNILSFARPMIAVARVMNNRWVANWMKNHHFRGPTTVIDKNRGFTSAVIRQWKDTKAAMTILMDQYAGNGAMLEFLGRPARTVTSVTRLMTHFGYPAMVASFVRVGPYKYKVVGGAPMRFAKTEDKMKATQLLNDRLGEIIRKYPEQYLWSHRRWRDD